MAWIIDDIISAGLNGAFASVNNQNNIMAQERANDRNYEAQKEFAQNSIQWKVNDAKNSGLHPLYALGNNATSFTPSFQASQSDAPRVNFDISGIMNLSTQLSQNDLLDAQKDYYKALAQQIRDESKAMPSQNSNQMQGLDTGVPLNGSVLGKGKGGKNAIVTNSAEEFTNLRKSAFDDSKYSLFPRGISDKESIKQYLSEYATDGNPNILGKISQYFNSLSPAEREYLAIDVLRSLGPTLELVDTRDKYATTGFVDWLLRMNLGLDDKIPLFKKLWR